MKKFSIALVALATALAVAPTAMADTFYFNVSAVGTPSLSVGGTLTGNALSPGVFNIYGGNMTLNGMSGTVISNPTPGLVSAITTPQGPYSYDDVLTLSPPYVDSTGGLLLFLLSNGGELELWSIGNTVYWNEFIPSADTWVIPLTGNEGDPVSFNVSTTPEPSSLILLGTGLLALAFLAFRKAKPVRSAGLALPV